jgi:UPF0271 protein
MRDRCDLNADLGESFGAWRMGDDEALLAQVSSCNIACGFHAGDPLTMQRTVASALARGVAVGAHPSLPDLVGFGRREMRVAADELHAMTLYQCAALDGFVRAAGARLQHVKPHGALYGMLARDAQLASAFVAAVAALDRSLAIYGPPHGAVREAAAAAGLRYLREGFADRGYLADANLVARDRPGAMLEVDAARSQGLKLARGEPIDAVDGSVLHLSIETLCLHGDGAEALALARALRGDLDRAGISVRAP